MRASFLFRTEKGGVFGEFCYLNAELSAVSGPEGMKFDYPGPQGGLGVGGLGELVLAVGNVSPCIPQMTPLWGAKKIRIAGTGISNRTGWLGIRDGESVLLLRIPILHS